MVGISKRCGRKYYAHDTFAHFYNVLKFCRERMDENELLKSKVRAKLKCLVITHQLFSSQKGLRCCTWPTACRSQQIHHICHGLVKAVDGCSGEQTFSKYLCETNSLFLPSPHCVPRCKQSLAVAKSEEVTYIQKGLEFF